MADEIIWRKSNLEEYELSGQEKLCKRPDPRREFRAEKQTNGLYRATCFLSNSTSGSLASKVASDQKDRTTTSIQINVSDTDLDALARVAAGEVGHFGKYGDEQLRGGLAAVVDTVFNRVAHAAFPNSIQSVIDQPKQFSPVNASGSWSGLPAAPVIVMDIVSTHIAARTAGKASEIKGSTHFLNPYLSSATTLASWGQYVVDNAIAIYGNDANRDVHYHGYAPGIKTPSPYILSKDDRTINFSAAGTSPIGLPHSSDLRDKIVAGCWAEYKIFSKGAAKENDDPQYKRVGKYWSLLDTPYDGRTMVQNPATGKLYNPPWSAAFVSFVVVNAGAQKRFPKAPNHSAYFQHFVDAGPTALYEAVPASEGTPKPGDILHFGREGAKQFGFADARLAFNTDGFYYSHGDIVVDVTGSLVTVIGGNVSNSVRTKTFQLNDDGLLKNRVENGHEYPWIGRLRLRG